MREHIVQTISSLSKHGKEIKEADMITWANEKTASSKSTRPKAQPMTSFKDAHLSSSLYFLDLLDALKPGIVQTDLVLLDAAKDGNLFRYIFIHSFSLSRSCCMTICCSVVEKAKMNAKYAISIARKLGATIFLLPEDIVEVKPKMILTFVGSLMALAL